MNNLMIIYKRSLAYVEHPKRSSADQSSSFAECRESLEESRNVYSTCVPGIISQAENAYTDALAAAAFITLSAYTFISWLCRQSSVQAAASVVVAVLTLLATLSQDKISIMNCSNSLASKLYRNFHLLSKKIRIIIIGSFSFS